MAFVNVELPPEILVGSSAGPTWNVDIIEYGQGSRQVNVNVPFSRYVFSLNHIFPNTEIHDLLLNFFEALGGPSTGFLLDNWMDNSTNNGGVASGTDMSLGAGDDTTLTFPLYRQYTFSTETRRRRIWKPKTDIQIPGYIVVYNATPAAGEASVNTDTGMVTFESPPASGVNLTWGGGYYLPVALQSKGIEGVVSSDPRWFDFSGLPLIELLKP